MKLQVCQAAREDVYRDIVRVPEKYRLSSNGRLIPDGSVCRITTPGGTAFGILRGLGDSSKQEVHIDERLRNLLGLRLDDEAEFRFEPVGAWGQFLWAWNASDPAYRVAARMSLLSVALGFSGLLLGLLSLNR